MRHRNILLTGPTGIMGSWVMGEALARGYNPVVLMRDTSMAKAQRRIRLVLDHVGRPQDMERVRIVLGDASLPAFGLGDSELNLLRRDADCFIHCAACTSFSPDKDEQCWSTNVGGVHHVLDFLNGTGIPLYHVSTAYLAGTRLGRVLETELDVNQGFNNTYERSKCTSEKLVRDAFEAGRVRGSIFRPSIIVGSSVDGRIVQFMNFYNLLRVMDLMAGRRFEDETVVRMASHPDGTKNLIPVDWTVKALWHIIEHEGASGQVYHLTNPDPMTHEQMRQWVNGDLLRSANVRIEIVDEFEGGPTALEAIFNARFQNYRPYMQREPIFDRTNTDRALRGAVPFPRVDVAHFERLMQFARQENWRSLFDDRSAAYRAAMSRAALSAAEGDGLAACEVSA